MMVGIVTLSFTLLSTAFMLLSYRYIISETRDRLERNAGYIASATGNYLQNFNSWNIFDNRADTWILYQTTMETVSSVSDASVIVASTQGEILYASDEGMYSKQIPQQIVDQILERGKLRRAHQLKRHLWEQPVYCRSPRPGAAGQPQLIGQCRGGSGFRRYQRTV